MIHWNRTKRMTTNKGRKQKLNAAEYDLLYAKALYCYLKNGTCVKHSLKKQMNRRYRRELHLDMLSEVADA